MAEDHKDPEPAKPAEAKPATATVEVKVEAKPAEPESKLGKFVLKYHNFLSTFVIGAAGLIATSLWQYRNSQIAAKQADAAQAVAKTQADNQWRIERAEILAKNLSILASRGEGSADQRYGVLLSLSRGEILDPELAVSYALELGNDNPEYMKSVLDSTQDKNYTQLAHAFVVTCVQRYGLARQVDACKNDTGGPRSEQIAMVVSDDAVTWATSATLTTALAGDSPAEPPPPGPITTAVASAGGPMAVLRDEEQVQKDLIRLTWLYTPAITTMYQHKQFPALRKFEAYSPGAQLISSLVIFTARTGESNESAEGTVKHHAKRKAWLSGYVLGKTCDDDCRARVADYVLTNLEEAQGDFDDLLQGILAEPPTNADPAVEKIAARLSRCQVDDDDLLPFRNRVLLPLLNQSLAAAKPNPAQIDAFLGLAALVPEPDATDTTNAPLWASTIARVQKGYPDKFKKYTDARLAADAARKAPPLALKKLSFCKAAEAAPTEDTQ